MNILTLLEEDGYNYQLKAMTHGGEYKGKCPWCGGKDRFSITPNAKNGGVYYCRQCQQAGGPINYLKDFRGMSYTEAALLCGKSLSDIYKPKLPVLDDTESWQPRIVEAPSKQWQTKATAFLFNSFKYLFSPSGKKQREYLNSRGITNQTIKNYRLGYNHQTVTFSRETWGLSPGKDIFIPQGIIIPLFDKSMTNVIRLRVRQDNPNSQNRYILIAASDTSYFTTLNIANAKPWIVIESELDAILVDQEAGDFINAVAIGNAQTRPDIKIHEQIKDNPILISLDNDSAGNQESSFFITRYKKAIQHKPLKKDPGEMKQAGLNIKYWVEQGIQKLVERGFYVIEYIQESQSKSYVELSPTKSIKQKINYPDPDFLKKSDPNPNFKSIVDDKMSKFPIIKCVHGRPCLHLSFEFCEYLKINVPVCKITYQYPFQIDKCPKQIWKKHTSGCVSSIILMPQQR